MSLRTTRTAVLHNLRDEVQDMSFDRQYVEYVNLRLEELPGDARPRWGKMNGEQMVNHLLGAVEYSLGKHGEAPPLGSLFLRYVIGPLAINGILRTPRNVVFRDPNGGVVTVPAAFGDRLALRAASMEFIERSERGDVRPPAHPAFGNLGYRGWKKLHYRHFEHHLGQFGI